MDANKDKKLTEIGYQIHPTCATCKHVHLANTRVEWGTCKKHAYKHMKHTEQDRQLSINRYGNCSNHQLKAEYQGHWLHFNKYIKHRSRENAEN